MSITHQKACKEVELTFSSASTSNAIAASGKTPAAMMAAGQAMGGMRGSSLPFVPDTKPASRSRTLSPEEEAKLLEDSKWNPEQAALLKAKAEASGVPMHPKQIQELYKEVWQFLRNLWRRVTHLDDDKRDELQPEEKAWMSEMEPLLKKINFTEVHRDNFRIRFQEILTCTRANLNQRPKNPFKAALMAQNNVAGILGLQNGCAPAMQAGRMPSPRPPFPSPMGAHAPPPPPGFPMVAPPSPMPHSPIPGSPFVAQRAASPHLHSPPVQMKRASPSPMSSSAGKRMRLDVATIGSSPWDGEATLCLICDLVDLVDHPATADQDRMQPEIVNFIRTAPEARIAQTVRPLTQQLSKFRPEQQAQIIDALSRAGFSITLPERPTIHSVSTSSRSSLHAGQHSSPTKKDTPWAHTPTNPVPLAHPAPMYAGTPGSSRLGAPSPIGAPSRGSSMADWAAQRRM